MRAQFLKLHSGALHAGHRGAARPRFLRCCNESPLIFGFLEQSAHALPGDSFWAFLVAVLVKFGNIAKEEVCVTRLIDQALL